MRMPELKDLSFVVTAAMAAGVLLAAGGCSSSQPARPRASRMGERVEVAPFVYTVIHAEWLSRMGEGAEERIPTNRYLVLQLSITNGGAQQADVPAFVLEDNKGSEFRELTEGVSVPEWLGILRRLPPAQTETGRVVFDVPVGAYRLRVSDGGEPDQEKTALIEIPINLETTPEVPIIPPPRPGAPKD